MFEMKSIVILFASFVIAALLASILLVAIELTAITGFFKFLLTVVTVLVASAVPAMVKETQF